MANLIRAYELNKSYNINSYPQQLFVVCDKENNPVTFSPKGYGTWKKPKMMYFTEGHAKAQAHDLNRRFGEEIFKVVRFVPSEEEND